MSAKKRYNFINNNYLIEVKTCIFLNYFHLHSFYF